MTFFSSAVMARVSPAFAAMSAIAGILQLRRYPSPGFLRGMDANLPESVPVRHRCFGLMTKVLDAAQRSRHGMLASPRRKVSAAGFPRELDFGPENHHQA